MPVKLLPSFYIRQIPYIVTPTSFPAVASIIREFRPDVSVCMHLVLNTTNSAVLASRLASVPALLGIRGPRLSFGSSFPNAGKQIFMKTVGKLSISLSSRILFDCKASMMSVPDRSIDSKSVILYDGVDTKKYTPREKTTGGLTVTFVGSLTPTKGLVHLVRAMPEIIASNKDVQFLLVGEGMQRSFLEGLVRRLGVERSVRFLGYRNDIPDILRETDVFVLPSVSEGVSTALLQAGACARPAVASKLGGNLEVISDGKDGYLVELGGKSLLAERINTLCADPPLRRRMGAEFRKKVVENFDLEPITDQLERIAVSVVKVGT
ncbi:MAG: glycosyltransferase [Thaumarchaeota archaeon]|nr:glycosyltransferase [Nitrososphaerota archaeon]